MRRFPKLSANCSAAWLANDWSVDVEKEKSSGLRQRIEAKEAELRLERDIVIARQRTGIDIRDEADMRAAVGTPVSLSDLTAKQREHLAAENREKLMPTFRELSEERMQLWARPLSRKNKAVKQQIEKHVYPHAWACKPVNRITTKDIQKWVNGVRQGEYGNTPLQPQSWTALRQWVQNVFANAEDDGLKKNPCKKVKFPKGSTAPRKQPRPTFAHIRTIMEDRELQWWAVYTILASTLMRPSSLGYILIERDIRWDDNEIDVRKSKNGQPYEVPIFPWMVEALEHLIGDRTEGPLTLNTRTGKPYAEGYDYRIKEAFAKYGWDDLEGYTLYGLKRRGGDAMLDGDFGKRVSIETVSWLMSHAEIGTTQKYCGANGKRAKRELRELTGWTNATTSIENALYVDVDTDNVGAGNEIRTHDFNLGKVALYR